MAERASALAVEETAIEHLAAEVDGLLKGGLAGEAV